MTTTNIQGREQEIVNEVFLQTETWYSILMIDINEIDHAKLGNLSPHDVLIKIGKTIESCIDHSKDRIFSKHYTNHPLHVGNKALMQSTDSFVVVSPRALKNDLIPLTQKIITTLHQDGVIVKVGSAEYGV